MVQIRSTTDNTSQEANILSSQKRAVSVLFTDQEYAGFVRRAAEMTLEEGRRVSVAELIRRLSLAGFKDGQDASKREGRPAGVE